MSLPKLMNSHDTDELGQRMAALLGEPQLPVHLQARLRSARAQALARKGRQESVVRVSGAVLAHRFAQPFWVHLGALLVVLTAGLFASKGTTQALEFDWHYHVQAEASDWADLDGGAPASP